MEINVRPMLFDNSDYFHTAIPLQQWVTVSTLKKYTRNIIN